MSPFALRPPAPRKGRAGRSLPVWGLRHPVTIEGNEELWRIEAFDLVDGILAEGFLAAHLAMPAFDLERRLWSGRLAEVLGEKLWSPGTTAADLDAFVRLLGFRRRAQQAFRRLEDGPRGEAEAYARGVNAWIDSGAWSEQGAWKSLRSRPRLWSSTDCLLAGIARGLVDSAGGPRLDTSDDAWAAGWTDAWDHRIRGLWEALHDDGLRARGAAGAGSWFPVEHENGDSRTRAQARAGRPSSFGEPTDAPARPPAIFPETILSGDDNHRVARPDGGFHRLRVQRPDIEVRGGATQRPWLRWSNRGGLVSDLLQAGAEHEAAAGVAFAWDWEGNDIATAGQQKTADDRSRPPLPDQHPWRLLPATSPPPRPWSVTLVPRQAERVT